MHTVCDCASRLTASIHGNPLAMAAVAKVAMTSAGELFTRGGPDVPETRGESMVSGPHPGLHMTV